MPTSPIARPMNSAVRPRSVLLPSTALTVQKASTISRKYSGGPSRTAYSATTGAKNVTSTVAIVPATKEPIAAVASAAPARPCLAILLPSMRGDHGAGLARRVEQDRGRRAAVHRAVVDAGKEDHRRGGLDLQRDRQQHRHRRGRADAGQHADGRADGAAEQAPQQVDRRARRDEALQELVAGCPCHEPSGRCQAGQVDRQQLG